MSLVSHRTRYVIGIIILAALIFFIYIMSLDYRGVPVLNYHLISSREMNALAITPQEFEEQMLYLRNNGYTAISPDQLVNYIQYNEPLPEKPVLITFDDGYRDTFSEAYPILKKYNLVATVFLITDYVGDNDRYLTWEQVKEMHANGIIFGSHTLNHVSLVDASPEYAEYQLTKSREGIEWRLKEPVKYFAYPGGFYNQAIIQLVKKAGYSAAFTTNMGRARSDSNLFALPRIPIFKAFHTFTSFRLRLKFTQLVIDANALRKFLTYK